MKPSIKPEVSRIDMLIDKKISDCKECLYGVDSEPVLTEFGAAKVLDEIPFVLLSQYIKLFDYYKIRKVDLRLIIETIDKQADSIKSITKLENIEPKALFNQETEDNSYDEWCSGGYEASLNKFYKRIDVAKERIKSSYNNNRVHAKEFWIPVIISIVSLVISLTVNLL